MTLSPKQLYAVLLKHFGTQHWWPVDFAYHSLQGSDPRFEVIIGAILTQNTAWVNVEKALANLKQNQVLSVQKMQELPDEKLKRLIQPSGFFNQKAQRLKDFLCYLQHTYRGDLDQFFGRETRVIRLELLSLNGVGPETADSILLYAGNHPVFVVDAYTKRVAARLPFPVNADAYDDVQQFFETELKKDYSEADRVSLYQEYHALLVELAKQVCKKKNPFCLVCPVRNYCDSSSVF